MIKFSNWDNRKSKSEKQKTGEKVRVRPGPQQLAGSGEESWGTKCNPTITLHDPQIDRSQPLSYLYLRKAVSTKPPSHQASKANTFNKVTLLTFENEIKMTLLTFEK